MYVPFNTNERSYCESHSPLLYKRCVSRLDNYKVPAFLPLLSLLIEYVPHTFRKVKC